jgi:predicted nucleotidyltransferase
MADGMKGSVKEFRAGAADYIHTEGIARRVAEIVRQITGDSSVAVLLFGSWADGSARLRSDIDIAVDGGPMDAADMAAIREACERMHTLYTIDLVDLAGTSTEFQESVRKHARRVNP